MGSIGFGELVVILLIVLVIFGAGKLPQIGDALGKSIRNFKKSSSGENEIDVTPRRDALPPASAEHQATPEQQHPARKA
jgi:sec-independent protein translocase protein TatA